MTLLKSFALDSNKGMSIFSRGKKSRLRSSPALKGIVFCTLLLLIVSHETLLSQRSRRGEAKDSTATKEIVKDSLQITNNIDSTKTVRLDTLPVYTPLHRHGSISLLDLPYYKKIAKEDIQILNYSSLSDLLGLYTDGYPLSQGEHGQFNHFSFFGGTPRDVGFMVNGRTLTHPAYGIYNPEHFPVEFMESAEILIGSDAVVLSDNSSGAAVNLQEIRYNTKSPYTRLWFSEGGGNFTGADGIFSQNIARNINFTFGFRNAVADGRFENAWFDTWNVRSMIRWNPSERSSISLSENFNNFGSGLNGGIDRTSSISSGGEGGIYDEYFAIPNYTDFNERIFRHDINLSFSSYLDSGFTAGISGTAFFSHSNQTFARSGEIFLSFSDSLARIDYSTYYSGINAKYEQTFGEVLAYRFGGEALYSNLPATIYNDGWNGLIFSGFFHTLFSPIKNFTLSGGGRIHEAYKKFALSFGGKLQLNLSDELGLNIDLSRSERLATPAEGIALSKESSYLVISGLSMKLDSVDLNLGGFSRITDSPLLCRLIKNADGKIINGEFYNGNNRKTLGFFTDFSVNVPINTNMFGINLKFHKLNINGFAQTYFNNTDNTNDKRLPLIYSSVEAYAQFLAGKSVLNIGLRAFVSGEQTGETFIPMKQGYSPYDITRQVGLDNIDVFAQAKLGTAYIRITFENLLSAGYYYTPLYPMMSRNIRLTLSWAFMD